MVYGGSLPALSFHYTGLVNGDAAVDTLPVLSTAAATSHAGNYAITASEAADADYFIRYENGTLAIGAAPLTITADDQSMVYGGSLPALSFHYTGLVNGDAAVDTLPVLSTAAATSHAGSYVITASEAADADYTISYASGTLAISAAPLTITADDQSMVYGASLPTLSFHYTGLVNGDTAVDALPVLSTAAATSHAGSYAITASEAADADYFIRYENGTLAIGAAPLTITADDQSMVYGGSLPALSFHYTGLVNGDAAVDTLPVLSTAAATSHAGSYVITASEAADADYTISYASGTLAISAAPLTITADDQSMVYGASLPTLSFHYTGLVNGDTAVDALPVLSTAAATSHAGSYAITASEAADADYFIRYENGTLAIGAAPLTITADDQSMVYGGPLPTLSFHYTGLVNGDTTVDTLPVLSTVAATSHVGSYAITASEAADADYFIRYENGMLGVIPAPLTVTVLDASRAYGDANPAFGGSIAGVRNGDTITVDYSTSATVYSGVGTYVTTATLNDPDGKLDNYSLVVSNGVLTVTPYAFTYTIGSVSQTYGIPADLGAELPGAIGTSVNGENVAISYRSEGDTATARVGNYAITGVVFDGTGKASNYAVTLVAGTLTVNQATPAITWSNPADITEGTPLGVSQLNATADVTGTFSYTPLAGTVLPAGNGQILSATFTPADALDYKLVTGTAVINVLPLTGLTTAGVNISAPAEVAFNDVVAVFQSNNLNRSSGRFTASINWGDDAGITRGLVGGGHGNFFVEGGHTYAHQGVYTVTVVITPAVGHSVTASSIATITANDNGLFVLDPSRKDALSVTGNGSIVITNGDLVIDSSNAEAAMVTGNGVICAVDIDVTGGIRTSGHAALVGDVEHTPSTADPLSGLGLPPAPSAIHGAVNYCGQLPLTLNPGTYTGGIKIAGNSAVTLNPGVYYLLGGGFSVSGNSSISGIGVLLVNASTKPSDSISLTGSGRVTLSPADSLTGAYAAYNGITIFQPAASSAAITIAGQADVNLIGILYAPGAKVSISGQGGLSVNSDAAEGCSAVIVDELSVAGNGAVTVNVSTAPVGATAASVAALDAYFSRLGTDSVTLADLVLAALGTNENRYGCNQHHSHSCGSGPWGWTHVGPGMIPRLGPLCWSVYAGGLDGRCVVRPI